MTLAQKQRAQLARYLEWKQAQGETEGPQRLSTMLSDIQRPRLEWLRQNVTGTVLEVGCGWGFVLAWVNGQAGVEINPALVELAQILSPEREFKTADARALPYEAESFDTVMLPEVLEHMEFHEVGGAVHEALRVARRRVLITVPDGSTETTEATCFKHRYLMDDEHLDWLLKMLPPCRLDRMPPFLYIRVDMRD